MKYSFILVVPLILLLGCKGDPGPAGPILSGAITGKVYLYADNNSLIQDKSGVLVTIDGGSSSAISSSDGFWNLTSVPAGVHNMVFSKTGFMTQKVFGFQFVGGGTVFWGNMALAQIPSVSVTQLKLTGPDANHALHIQVTISSSDSIYRDVGIIFDKIPISLSSTVSFLFDDGYYIQPDSTSFSYNIQFSDYLKAEYGVATGSKLYVRAYPLPRSGYYEPYNPSSGKYEVYDLQNAFSNLDSLIVP